MRGPGTRAACLLATLVALVLWAAGCGGDDDSEPAETATQPPAAVTGTEPAPDPGEALERDEYVERAEEICDQVSRDTLRMFFALDEGASDEDLDEVLGRMMARTREALAELRALPAPEGDEEELDEWLEALEADIEAAEREIEADPSTALAALDGMESRADPLAEAYGLEACAGDDEPLSEEEIRELQEAGDPDE